MSNNAQVFLAFVKGRVRKELREGVMETALTVKELYEHLWSISPFYKKLHQEVGRVSLLAILGSLRSVDNVMRYDFD